MTTYTTESTHVVFTALSNTPNFCFSKCSSSQVFTVRITQLLPFTEGLYIFSCAHSALSPQEGPYIYIEASQKTSYHYLLLMMINTGLSLGLYFSLVYNYTPKFFFFLHHKSEETMLKSKALPQPYVYCADADSKTLFVCSQRVCSII